MPPTFRTRAFATLSLESRRAVIVTERSAQRRIGVAIYGDRWRSACLADEQFVRPARQLRLQLGVSAAAGPARTIRMHGDYRCRRTSSELKDDVMSIAH